MPNNRQGYYRQIGKGDASFSSFVPVPLQEIYINVTTEMNRLCEVISERLETLETKSDEELDMLINDEVSDSWALSNNNEDTDEEDEQEMADLRRATEYAFSALDELPLSGRIIKNAHYLMLQSPRYDKKYPGEFRTSPIWIGHRDTNLQNAAFIPPTGEDMSEAFYQLEQYINTPQNYSPFIQAALIHYQFETIHPFIDGNGRIGRLMVMLFLHNIGLLQKPVLSLSSNLRKAEKSYYSGISHVQTVGSYEKWIDFFLHSLM